MKPPCPNCRTIHGTDCTIAVGRFTKSTKYRGNFTNAPFRSTRKEAEQDYCNYKIKGSGK